MNTRALPFSEQIFTTSDALPLNGVLTLSAATTGDPQRPMLVLLNAGLLHHIGTCRLYVKLARSAATRGLHALRFDHSGIGDSQPRSTPTSYSEKVAAEVTEVLDALQSAGIASRFILCGLCSGAATGLAVAAADERIVGIAQIAPASHRTFGWYLYYAVAQARRLTRIPQAIRKRLGNKAVGSDSNDSIVFKFGDDGADPDQLDRETLVAAYGNLFDRGGRAMVIMTRGEHEYYNHEGQFARLLSRVSKPDSLSEHYFPNTRHIITEPEDQAEIITLITDWSAALADRGDFSLTD